MMIWIFQKCEIGSIDTKRTFLVQISRLPHKVVIGISCPPVQVMDWLMQVSDWPGITWWVVKTEYIRTIAVDIYILSGVCS